MKHITSIVANVNESSVELNAGEGVTGALVKKTDPEDVDEVSFACLSPTDSINVGALLLFHLHTMSTKCQVIIHFRITVCFLDVIRFIYHLSLAH